MTWWWPWGGRHVVKETGGAAAAAAALEGLAEEKARSTEVHEVSESLRSHRERNHFADLLQESMRRDSEPYHHRRLRRRR